MRLFLIETWASQDQHIMVACMPPLLLFCFSEEFVSCSNIHICQYFPEHFYWRIFLTEYLNCPNSLHKGQWLGIGDHNETQLQTLGTKYSAPSRRFVYVVCILLKILCYVVYFWYILSAVVVIWKNITYLSLYSKPRSLAAGLFPLPRLGNKMRTLESADPSLTVHSFAAPT